MKNNRLRVLRRIIYVLLAVALLAGGTRLVSTVLFNSSSSHQGHNSVSGHTADGGNPGSVTARQIVLVPQVPQAAGVNKLPIVNVTTSASRAATWGPEMAVDGVYDSAWSAGGTSMPQWLQVDLGTTTTISVVRTFWFNATRSIYTYTIQVSTDGNNWRTVTGSKASDNNFFTDDTFPATQARFIRITITASTNNFAAINEIEVYNGSPSFWAGIPAARAADFLNSLGVNTHFDQGTPGYGSGDISRDEQALQYIGIRHLREGNIPVIIQLHQQLGITADILNIGSPNCQFNGNPAPPINLADLIKRAKQLAANNALLAIEGPNEVNNWPITYQGQCSKNDYTVVARYMRDLYSAVKSDPVLGAYPVWQASGAGPGAETNNAGLQFITIPPGAGTLMPAGTRMADYATLHNYVEGTSTLQDNEAWNMSHPLFHSYGDALYGEAGLTWARHFPGYSPMQLLHLPRVTTETGWSMLHPTITETQQAGVFLDTVLSQFKNGFKYTFIYELRDENVPWDTRLGLLRMDGTYRPAAVYLHNLTTILADNGSLRTTGSVPYSIANQPDTTHTLLLQKSNGKFDLVVWDEKAGGSDSITVNLGSTQSTVTVYDPTVGTGPVQTLNNVSSVPLTLGAHAVILEFNPAT